MLFLKCIVDWLAASFEEKEGIDIRNDKQALVRVLEAAEDRAINAYTNHHLVYDNFIHLW